MDKQLKPTIARPQSMFELIDDTGDLKWKIAKSNCIKAGSKAGAVDTNGRLRVEIDGRSYGAHQIVFALAHGRWPAQQIDHIDGDKINNKPSNLREASNAENSRNRHNTRSTTGLKGVSFHKRQRKYAARIMVDGKAIHLGSYDDPQVAAHEYNKAAVRLHGDFALLNPVGADYDIAA